MTIGVGVDKFNDDYVMYTHRKLAEDTRVKTVMINIGDGCTLVTKL